MTRPAIVVNNLSKSYQIGRKADAHGSFREAIVGAVSSPFRKLKRLGGESSPDETFWALKDVSFEVQPGEVVGVIGRNGAGKSTLLKILSRITEPTSGEVRLRGRVASLLEVGTGFHPELTGRENIYLNGAILGMKRAEIDRKFDEIVAFAEVEKFLDTPVKRYSSGMYVRLAFSVAAHLEPEILIVDEVLAVGDAQFQKKCLGKMQEVAAGEGRTVLFVSHHMGMVRSLCSRAILLDGGRKVFDGEIEDGVDFYERISAQGEEVGHVQMDSNNSYPMQILEAQIVDGFGRQVSKVDLFEAVSLRIRYVVRRPLDGANIAVIIHYRGAPLLVTFDTDESTESLINRQPGQYESTIDLPSSSFKPGSYAVSFDCGFLNRGEKIQRLDNALRFEVRESIDTSLKSYASKRPGLIAMKTPWRVIEHANVVKTSL